MTDLSPPPARITARLYALAARQRAAKEFLHEHRQDALTCYDHPDHYCCVCGEHMTVGYTEHMAAQIVARERAAEARVLRRFAVKITTDLMRECAHIIERG